MSSEASSSRKRFQPRAVSRPSSNRRRTTGTAFAAVSTASASCSTASRSTTSASLRSPSNAASRCTRSAGRCEPWTRGPRRAGSRSPPSSSRRPAARRAARRGRLGEGEAHIDQPLFVRQARQQVVRGEDAQDLAPCRPQAGGRKLVLRHPVARARTTADHHRAVGDAVDALVCEIGQPTAGASRRTPARRRRTARAPTRPRGSADPASRSEEAARRSPCPRPTRADLADHVLVRMVNPAHEHRRERPLLERSRRLACRPPGETVSPPSPLSRTR